MKIVTVTAVFEVDNDVHVKDVERYAREALGLWGGQFPPGDPFFGDNKRITITARKGNP